MTLTGFVAVVHRKLQALGEQQRGLDREVMEWLSHAVEHKLHLQLGMGSMVEYCERVLGYDVHTARDRVRVARALIDLPKLENALAAGTLSYSAAREVSRVATSETEQAWVEFATGRPAREVEQAVSGRTPGELPTSPKQPDRRLSRMAFDVTAEQDAEILSAVDALRKSTGSELSMGAAIALLCRRAFQGGESLPERAPLSMGQCHECARGFVDAHGTRRELEPEAIERRLCDPKITDGVGKKTVEIPAATRRAVWLRDQGRCVVPGCRNHRYVEIHHRKSILEGGDHSMENLMLMCDAHHDAFHRGLLKIFGTIGVDLRFEDAHATDLRTANDPCVTRPDLDDLATAQIGRSQPASAPAHMGRAAPNTRH